MRRLLPFILFMCSSCLVFSQAENKSLLLIEGRIVDELHNPVSYVNIWIKGRSTGAVGDYEGKYRIAAFPGDTITFSAVSFRHTSFITPGNMEETVCKLDVILESDTIGLKEVVVYPWPSTLGQLKKEFLEIEVEDPLADLDLHLPSPEEMKMLYAAAANRVPGMVSISAPGPISFLYDRYSKEAKQKKAYAEAVRQEKAEKRYNRTVIAQITGLKDEQKISEFMKFCPIDANFVLRSTDYELFLAIRDCYEEFAQLQVPRDSIPH